MAGFALFGLSTLWTKFTADYPDPDLKTELWLATLFSVAIASWLIWDRLTPDLVIGDDHIKHKRGWFRRYHRNQITHVGIFERLSRNKPNRVYGSAPNQNRNMVVDVHAMVKPGRVVSLGCFDRDDPAYSRLIETLNKLLDFEIETLSQKHPKRMPRAADTSHWL